VPTLAAILIAASALIPSTYAQTADQTAAPAPNICWAPDAFASAPTEKAIFKGDHRYDAPPSQTELAPYSPIPAGLRGAIRSVKISGPRKLIALTFDLCEQPGEVAGYDGAIFEYLRANGIKATFFAGGKWMRSHAERAQQLMTDPLFEMGNHSEAHRNLRLLTGARLDNEILSPQRAFENLRRNLVERQCTRDGAVAASTAAPRMGLFRFPYGACSPESLAAVNDRGLLAIQWDHSTGDPAPAQSAKAIAAAMLRNVKPGSIIIAHANGRGYHTSAALPLALPALRAKGFEFVTVSELLAAGTPEIVQSCYDSRPGDTDRYDHLLALKHPPKAK
jgi:peptidoglycan/xylan/chitin deacetylase (PgdA/CDA1 family)